MSNDPQETSQSWHSCFSNVSVVSGYIYNDKWVSPSLQAIVVPGRTAAAIRFRIWNPNGSSQYDQNHIYLAYGGAKEARTSIKMGETVDFLFHQASIEGRPELLTISSRSSMPPNDKDQRILGLVVLGVWLYGADQVGSVKASASGVEKDAR